MNLNKLNRNKTNSFFSIWQFEKNLWNNSGRLTTQSLMLVAVFDALC